MGIETDSTLISSPSEISPSQLPSESASKVLLNQDTSDFHVNKEMTDIVSIEIDDSLKNLSKDGLRDETRDDLNSNLNILINQGELPSLEEVQAVFTEENIVSDKSELIFTHEEQNMNEKQITSDELTVNEHKEIIVDQLINKEQNINHSNTFNIYNISNFNVLDSSNESKEVLNSHFISENNYKKKFNLYQNYLPESLISVLETQTVELLTLATKYLKIHSKLQYFNNSTVPTFLENDAIERISTSSNTIGEISQLKSLKLVNATDKNVNNVSSSSEESNVSEQIYFPKYIFNQKFLLHYYNNTIESYRSILSCKTMWQKNQRKEFYKHISSEFLEIEKLFESSYPIHDIDDALSLMRKDSVLTRKMSSLLHSEGLKNYFTNQEQYLELQNLLHELWIEQNTKMTPDEVRHFTQRIFKILLKKPKNNFSFELPSTSNFHVVWMNYYLWNHINRQLKDVEVNDLHKLKAKSLGALSHLRFFISVFWDPYKFGHLKSSESNERLNVQHENSRAICDLMKKIANGGVKQRVTQDLDKNEVEKNNILVQGLAKDFEEYYNYTVNDQIIDHFFKVDWIRLIYHQLLSYSSITTLSNLVVISLEDSIDLQNFFIEEKNSSENKFSNNTWDIHLPSSLLTIRNENFINRIPLTLLVNNTNTEDDNILSFLEQELISFHEYLTSKGKEFLSEELELYCQDKSHSIDILNDLQILYPYYKLMISYLKQFEDYWTDKLKSLIVENDMELSTLQNEFNNLLKQYNESLKKFGNDNLANAFETVKHTKLQKKMKPTPEMIKNGFIFGFKLKDLLEQEIILPSERSEFVKGDAQPKHIFEFYRLPEHLYSLQLLIKDYHKRRRLSPIHNNFPIIGGQIMDINEILDRIIENGEIELSIRGEYSINIPKLLHLFLQLLNT